MLSIHFKQHHLDRMLFYKREHGKPMAVCIVYVDDFLLTCRTDCNKEELLQLFSWGSQKQLSIEDSLELKGKELKLAALGTSLQLQVTQTKFIENTDAGKLKKKRISEGGPRQSSAQ